MNNSGHKILQKGLISILFSTQKHSRDILTTCLYKYATSSHSRLRYRHRTYRMESRFWRLLGNYERNSKYYQKVYLSLSDSFCFVNCWGEFISPNTQNGIEILTFTGELWKGRRVFLSLSDSFCFVNFWGEFLFSILVKIYDIFVQ